MCRLRRKAGFVLTTANWVLKPICALFAVFEECRRPCVLKGGWTDTSLGTWGEADHYAVHLEVTGNRTPQSPILFPQQALTAVKAERYSG